MADLKPCPFCGNKEVAIRKGKYMWWGVCIACGASGAYKSRKAEAIEAWNRRVGDGTEKD